MAYTSLSNGSTGEDVRKMQQTLMNAGYNLGAGGADGIFGNDTMAAVQKYQMDNGMTVSGVADDSFQNHLYTGGSPSTGASGTTTPAEAIKPTTAQRYDPSADEAYQQALSVLQAAQNNAPSYTNSYDGQLAELYDQIVNRDKFSYDLNADMIWKQYTQQYVQNGQLAMQDTMGQAAGLTGGYGSSYSQQVGQQTYDAYLQQLNQLIPDLYDRAYRQYLDEGDDMLTQYSMLNQMKEDEYGRYKDSYSMWLNDRDYYQGLADQAYNRGHSDWESQYGIQKDNRSYLTSLISGTGYNPTDGELANAGMTREQANALLSQYIAANTPTGGGGGGSGSGSSGSKGSKMTLQQMVADELRKGTPVAEVNSAVVKYYNDHKDEYSVDEVRDAMISNTAANLTVNGYVDMLREWM